MPAKERFFAVQGLRERDTLFEDSLDIHGIDWISVFGYFDETGLHGAAIDTVVAGYVFSKDGAKQFRSIFDENILPLLPPDKHGNRIFHASQCILGYRQFEGIPEPERNHIVDLMVDAIKASVMFGVVVGMEKSEYCKAIDRSPHMRQIAGDEYSVCLMRCIENLAEHLDSENIQGRVEYVFEAGCEHQAQANSILGRIANSAELKGRFHWGDYSFREKTENIPQLFAADLLAWEWQRARVNSLYPQRNEWRMTLHKLISEQPYVLHLASYLDSTSVGIRGLINAFYDLVDVPPKTVIPF